MPNFFRQALIENHVLNEYNARPSYQRNDYISWVNRAVMTATKQKRINQMIDELKRGSVYMKMKYKTLK